MGKGQYVQWLEFGKLGSKLLIRLPQRSCPKLAHVASDRCDSMPFSPKLYLLIDLIHSLNRKESCDVFSSQPRPGEKSKSSVDSCVSIGQLIPSFNSVI